jgi:hypothetical protein
MKSDEESKFLSRMIWHKGDTVVVSAVEPIPGRVANEHSKSGLYDIC